MRRFLCERRVAVFAEVHRPGRRIGTGRFNYL
jgi:hypothetical protein